MSCDCFVCLIRKQYNARIVQIPLWQHALAAAPEPCSYIFVSSLLRRIPSEGEDEDHPMELKAMIGLMTLLDLAL
jgi:hypothetical protein